MDLISNKYVSLACALLNCVFAYAALTNGSWFWFLFSVALGYLCYNNYKNAD